MKFRFGNRRVEIELQAFSIALLVLGWALFYYISIVSQPDGKESVLFIKPLTISLAICFIFVIPGTIKVERIEKEVDAGDGSKSEDAGFLDHRRLFFAGSMIAYAAALTLFGFMVPSILFLFILFYYLGVRNRWILIVIPLCLPALLGFVFVYLMKVPIAVWPSW